MKSFWTTRRLDPSVRLRRATARRNGRGGGCSGVGRGDPGLTVHVAADRNVRAPAHPPSLRYGTMQRFNARIALVVVILCALTITNLKVLAQPARTNLDFNFYTTTEITNVHQIRLLATQIPTANYSFKLEGDVWWANPAEGRFVLKDDSGAEELEMNLEG